ncbi:DNA polymerase alpha 70 kDa subunit, partial [Aureobasidium melanogenum]
MINILILFPLILGQFSRTPSTTLTNGVNTLGKINRSGLTVSISPNFMYATSKLAPTVKAFSSLGSGGKTGKASLFRPLTTRFVTQVACLGRPSSLRARRSCGQLMCFDTASRTDGTRMIVMLGNVWARRDSGCETRTRKTSVRVAEEGSTLLSAGNEKSPLATFGVRVSCRRTDRCLARFCAIVTLQAFVVYINACRSCGRGLKRGHSQNLTTILPGKKSYPPFSIRRGTRRPAPMRRLVSRTIEAAFILPSLVSEAIRPTATIWVGLIAAGLPKAEGFRKFHGHRSLDTSFGSILTFGEGNGSVLVSALPGAR